MVVRFFFGCMIFVIFYLLIKGTSHYEYFSSITIPNIHKRFIFLIKKININPYKIEEKDFNKILVRYKYIFPIKMSNNSNLFNQLDVYNNKYINYKTITYLYFSLNKNSYLDKTNYEYNHILNTVKKSDIDYGMQPYNSNIIYNTKNTGNNVVQYDFMENIDMKKPLKYKNIFIRNKNCIRPYAKCNSVSDFGMYGLNSII